MSASRIDFMVVNHGLADNVSNIEYSYGCRTDHSLLSMEININDIKRGPGIWKLNNKLLMEEEYINSIKECIIECKKECRKAGMRNS